MSLKRVKVFCDERQKLLSNNILLNNNKPFVKFDHNFGQNLLHSKCFSLRIKQFQE